MNSHFFNNIRNTESDTLNSSEEFLIYFFHLLIFRKTGKLYWNWTSGYHRTLPLWAVLEGKTGKLY